LVLMGRSAVGAGATAEGEDGTDEAVRRAVEHIGVQDPPLVVSTRRMDISSTEIRERVRLRAPIRGFVTDEVARFIEASGLYR
jgi:nicotinic acid mononucleotide adenylyltransferase